MHLCPCHFTLAGKTKLFAIIYSLPKRLELLDQEVERMSDSINTNHVILFDNWNQHLFDYGGADLWLLPALELVAELENDVIFKVSK